MDPIPLGPPPGGTICEQPVPEPGAPRPWETAVQVGTYSVVNMRNLNLLTTIDIIGWTGSGPDMDMKLYHNSANVNSALDLTRGMGFSLGAGWSCSFSAQLIIDTDTVIAIADDGTQDVYTKVHGVWVAADGVFDVLTKNGTTWELRHKDQSFHEFRSDGLLIGVGDATGKRITVNHTSAQFSDPIVSVVDAAGRVLEFHYSFKTPGIFELAFITDPIEAQDDLTYIQARSWVFRLDSNDNLDQVLDPVDGEYRIVQDATSGLLTSIADRWLPGETQHDYVFTYTTDNKLETVTDPKLLTQSFTASCIGQPYSQSVYTDVFDNAWTYEFDWPSDALRRVENPLGKEWTFESDTDKNVTLYRDPLLNEWTYTYDGVGNLLTATDPLTHAQTWTYNGKNNVTSYTDALGNVTSYRYDDSLWPNSLTHIDEPPLQQGGPVATTTLSYQADGAGVGQLDRVTDPNGVVTVFDYDIWGQLDEYVEGEIGGSPVVTYLFNSDSGSRTYASSGAIGGTATASLGGGTSSHNSVDQLTGTICVVCDESCGSAAAAGNPLVPSWFPPKPCNSPDIGTQQGSLINVTYNGLGRALQTILYVQYRGLSPVRTFTDTYDELGLLTSHQVDTEEHGAPARSFSYSRDYVNNTATRTGPDGVETFVQFDAAGRVDYVRRGPPDTLLIMSAGYDYYDDNLLQKVTFNNGVTANYTYDNARRLTRIEYLKPSLNAILLLDYTYNDRNEIVEIDEINPPSFFDFTTITYDTRGRLLREVRRTGFFQIPVIDLTYTYDDGGNRLTKVDAVNNTEVVYHYDNENTGDYGSFNNRLGVSELRDTGVTPSVLISETFYYYTGGGNLEFIGTRLDTETTLTGTQFIYAGNGRAVTYALGISWDGALGCPTPDVAWGREFRYDSGRQRYYSAELDPVALAGGNIVVASHTWTDYDGENAYVDYTVTSGNVSHKRSWEPGIGANDPWSATGETNTKYFVMNHLGTTRMMTDTADPVNIVDKTAYTAFGERVSGTDHHYGYAGAFGYQAPASENGTDPYLNEFPYLHVGARYYDPGSGRFLQRDPIGIRGGLNVYAYVGNVPTRGVDPTGLFDYWEGGKWLGAGIVGAVALVLLTPVTPTVIAAAVCTAASAGLMGGMEPNDGPDLVDFLIANPPPVYIPSSGNSILNCFVDGTSVWTPEGLVDIATIALGAHVLSTNPQSDDVSDQVIIGKRSGFVRELVVITIPDEIIRCTSEHPFWIKEKGWTKAAQLSTGDILQDASGAGVAIVKVATEVVTDPVQVQTITVGGTHTYFIGKSRVLVHNKPL